MRMRVEHWRMWMALAVGAALAAGGCSSQGGSNASGAGGTSASGGAAGGGAAGGSGGTAGSSTGGGGGFPDQTNTGYENAPGYPGSLKDCQVTTVQSNTTYKFCNFPNGLDIGNSTTHPTNVTFLGCRFASAAEFDANVADYGSNTTFDYDTFEPNTVPAGSEPTDPHAQPVARASSYQYGIDQRHAGPFTVDHCDFWGFAEGIQFGSSSQSGPLVVRNSWLHNPRDPGGTNASTDDHTDGILENYGGLSYMTFDHNSIVGDGNTQALALQGSVKYDHVTITNNYFSGYGYMTSIGAHTQNTNVTFTGNVWSTEFEPAYGPIYDDVSFVTAGLGNTWNNNTIHVAPGTSWMAAGNDGLFWWPGDGNPSSATQIVGHNTDYTGP